MIIAVSVIIYLAGVVCTTWLMALTGYLSIYDDYGEFSYKEFKNTRITLLECLLWPLILIYILFCKATNVIVSLVRAIS